MLSNKSTTIDNPSTSLQLLVSTLEENSKLWFFNFFFTLIYTATFEALLAL